MNRPSTTSLKLPHNLFRSRLTPEAPKLLRQIIPLLCLVATFIANADEQLPAKAKSVVDQPANAELQLLQGTWEGVLAGDKAQQKVTVTITGNSLHFYRDTNFWWKTTMTLSADTNPRQLHAVITDCHDCAPQQENSVGKVVVAIFKIEDGTLTLATGNGDGVAPKSFEGTVDNGLNRYELRKVQPPKKINGTGLGSLLLEGHEFHRLLKTRHIDDSVRHVPRALIPENPHLSTNAPFVEAIARNASQESLDREGIRSALYALYHEKSELGFYGLEAVSATDADLWEEALRKAWANNARQGLAQVHRNGLLLTVVWTDGVSPECWEAVKAESRGAFDSPLRAQPA